MHNYFRGEENAAIAVKFRRPSIIFWQSENLCHLL